MTSFAAAKSYIQSLDLSGTPRQLIEQDAATEASQVFDQAKAQARVVGSELLAFREGVLAETREAISDSALLAQLVANKRADAAADPIGWFRQYANVLENVGWTMQEHGWNDVSASGTAADVHEKIIELLPTLLGTAPGALAVVTAAVNALRGMDPKSSWIKIFSRETQKANIARFQVGLVDDDNGAAQVSLLACVVQARSAITQVLLFKIGADQASFQASATKVSINSSALRDLTATIRAKVRAYQMDYLSSIKDI
jgi:hypothetical protein